ncbi:MAG: 50S ribosomal protein L25 [Opitutaceae bacterium]|nr:50S ribosomal protein L25 [Opitutaceae bacterium]|tara:strand:- start:13739 stop:14419 length:681 start_codon:yes stop_codon:yes gene_type:complete
MSQLNISINAREEVGRGASRRLRGSGKLPGVIYSKGESRAIFLDNKDFENLWHDLIGRTPLVTLNEGKNESQALISEVQRHPLNDSFIHVDFHEVTAGEEITAQAALQVTGEPVGVRNEGGTLEVHLHEVEVRSRPRNIPDFIEIDVSELNLGDALHVSDLPKLEGVTYQLHEDTLIASVSIVKIEEGPELEVEELLEGEEGEGESEGDGEVAAEAEGEEFEPKKD